MAHKIKIPQLKIPEFKIERERDGRLAKVYKHIYDCYYRCKPLA